MTPMWAEFQHSTVRSACTTTECCKRHPKACRRSWESATASLAGEHLDADAHAHTHVTYVAFSGRDDVVREVGRSAFSLLRASRSARVHVLTDDSRMRKALLAAGLPSQATVQDVARSLVLARLGAFGLRKLGHHSGVGGYAKLLVAELLPPTIHATIVLDSDTIVVADTWPLWASLKAEGISAGATRGVLAAKRLRTGGACLRGQRLNSGVVVMDLALMRARNWTGRLLERIAALGRPNVPARSCGKMVRNGSLVAGDQELLSYACLKAPGSCVALPDGMHQDKCEGLSGGRRAIVLHFNCGGDAPGSCPGSGPCARVAQEYARLYGVAWRAAG